MQLTNLTQTQKTLISLTIDQQKLLLQNIKNDNRAGAIKLRFKIQNNINLENNEVKRLKKLAQLESSLNEQGFVNIAGVDEAGRGPLAGPIVSAAVILPSNVLIKGLNDSKKLTQLKRENLFEEITAKARSYSIKIFDNSVIDSKGLHNTNLKALRDAVIELNIKPDFVLVDGYKIDYSDIPSLKVINGDQVSTSIAAASILAKVYRDRLMLSFHDKYPQYDFRSHKGYGSQAHMQALEKHGICPIHRKSFEPIRKIIK